MADLKTTAWCKYATTDITADQGVPTRNLATAPTNMFGCQGFRSARVRFYGDANDVTITPHIYLVHVSRDSATSPTSPPEGGAIVMYTTELLADIAECTAGTTVGVAGANATAGENYFGTVGAETVSPWGTLYLADFNGVLDVHSVDNAIGEVFISDLGNAEGIHIRFELGTAVLANAEICLDT